MKDAGVVRDTTGLRISIPSLFCLTGLLLGSVCMGAQEDATASTSSSRPVEKTASTAHGEPALEVPTRVHVQPVARDDQISQRLTRILRATGWFQNPRVQVEEGVVFLQGETETEQYKRWAGDLARNTQDVAAVVNQIAVTEPSAWSLRPAFAGLRELWTDFAHSLPFLGFGLVILFVSWQLARLAARGMGTVLHRWIPVQLLRAVLARAVGLLVFLFGLYIVLKISGLTRLALTVVGGTGLVGLVIGIAFRDITENFLASIMLSVQRPFRAGDLVDVADVLGYVQQLNVRTTVIMTLTGNLVQIPNSTVYKSIIRNYTSNPNRREDFLLAVTAEANIPAAQEIALRVLAGHPAVLKEPEPWVLVNSVGLGLVNLRVYFWMNGREHSWLKVRSSVMRLVKNAFHEEGVPVPNATQDIAVVKPIHVEVGTGDDERNATGPARLGRHESEAEAVSTKAEGGLHSDEKQIEDQARQSRTSEHAENLLNASPNGSDARSAPGS